MIHLNLHKPYVTLYIPVIPYILFPRYKALGTVSMNGTMCTLHRIGVSGHRRLEHNNITTNKLSGFSIDSLINSK